MKVVLHVCVEACLVWFQTIAVWFASLPGILIVPLSNPAAAADYGVHWLGNGAVLFPDRIAIGKSNALDCCFLSVDGSTVVGH